MVCLGSGFYILMFTLFSFLFLHQSYKLDCFLTNSDAHVTGGSEDGYVFFWDLVDASVVSRFRAHASVVMSFSICLFFCLSVIFAN